MFSSCNLKSSNVASAILLLFLLLPCSSFAEKKLSKQQVQQKIQLVEYVLADIKKKAGSLFNENMMLKGGYDYAKVKITEAKQAIDANQVEQAAALAEEAFLNMSYARTFVQKKEPSIESYKEEFAKTSQAVTEYIDTLTETLSQNDEVLGRSELDNALTSTKTAKQLFSNNQFKDANLEIEKAYNLLVGALGRIKDNTTTVVSLHFETPKDEYLYELKRVDSFQMLLQLRKANTEIDANTDKLVSGYVTKSDSGIDSANQAAEQGDFLQAIKLLEEANENLKRALRMTGLNMF